MRSLNPIDLLEKELKENEHALEKSIRSYNKGDLDAATHLQHKERLRPLIADYTYAIFLLKKHKK